MPGPPPPLNPAMFFDTVTVAVSGYFNGLHAGPSPILGTPVLLDCYVESGVGAARDLPGTQAGQPMDVSDYYVFAADPGNGSPPVIASKDDVIIWGTHYGVTMNPYIIMTVNTEWRQQGTLWVIGCKQQV